LLRESWRDHASGITALYTNSGWNPSGEAENAHIPLPENTYEVFNSSLVYEHSALRQIADRCCAVPFGTRAFFEAKLLLTFLEWFPAERCWPIPVIDRTRVPGGAIGGISNCGTTKATTHKN